VTTTTAETSEPRRLSGATLPLPILITLGTIAIRLKQARPSLEMEQTTEDDSPRPKMDFRVNFGHGNLHTSMNIHLRRYQIKALVNTTTAETLRITQDYGAIPLILECAGKTANRLISQQVTKRKRKKI